MASPLSIGSARSPVLRYEEKKPLTPKPGPNPPADIFGLVYWNIFFQGIAAHFPWNVLLAGQKFFQVRLKGLSMASDFLSHFTIIFMLVKYAFLMSAMFFLRKYNPKMQVYVSIIGNALTLLGLTISCCMTKDQVTFYLSTLVLVLFSSLFSAVFEAGIFTIIGQFPTAYTQSFIAGHGVGGVVVITVSIASYFIAGTFDDPEFAKIYFGSSAALLAISFVLFLVLQANPFYQHYNKVVEEVAELRRQEVEENVQVIKHYSMITEVFKEIREIAIAAFIGSTVGFTIFPMYMFATHSVVEGTAKANWFHNDMFMNFALLVANIFDMVGKLLPLIPVLSFQSGPYIGFALSRLVLVPFYLLGNIKFEGYRLGVTPVLGNDILFYVITAISALQSSYLATVSMMWAPSRVRPKERTVAIAIVIMMGCFGFITGTILSMMIKYILLQNARKIVII